MLTQGYTATLVAATLAISRSSLHYEKRPRGSRADMLSRVAEARLRFTEENRLSISFRVR
jgi:hypothetical protein